MCYEMYHILPNHAAACARYICSSSSFCSMLNRDPLVRCGGARLCRLGGGSSWVAFWRASCLLSFDWVMRRLWRRANLTAWGGWKLSSVSVWYRAWKGVHKGLMPWEKPQYNICVNLRHADEDLNYTDKKLKYADISLKHADSIHLLNSAHISLYLTTRK